MVDAASLRGRWEHFFRDAAGLRDDRIAVYTDRFTASNIEPRQIEGLILCSDYAVALSNLKMAVPDANFDELVKVRSAAEEMQRLHAKAERVPADDDPRVKRTYDRVKKFQWHTKTMGVTDKGEPKEDDTRRCLTILNDSYAVSAAHLIFIGAEAIMNCRFIVYCDEQENESYELFLAAIDREKDIAVLKWPNMEKFPAYPKTYALPSEGDEYVVVGYPDYCAPNGPFQLGMSVFPGYVMCSSFSAEACRYANRLQWNCLGVFGTRRGCSGGGVFRLDGKLIGICVAGKDSPSYWSHQGLFEKIYTHLSEPSITHFIPTNTILDVINNIHAWPTMQLIPSTSHGDDMDFDSSEFDKYLQKFQGMLSSIGFPSSHVPEMKGAKAQMRATNEALLGKRSMTDGDLRSAINSLNMAVALSPENPDYHLDLAEALYAHGAFDVAGYAATMGRKLCKRSVALPARTRAARAEELIEQAQQSKLRQSQGEMKQS